MLARHYLQAMLAGLSDMACLDARASEAFLAGQAGMAGPASLASKSAKQLTRRPIKGSSRRVYPMGRVGRANARQRQMRGSPFQGIWGDKVPWNARWIPWRQQLPHDHRQV